MERIWSRIIAIALVIGVGAAATHPARADFVSLNSGFGAGTLTLDTTTGLEWLNVSIPSGQSYNTVISQMGSGGEYQGYQYATGADVVQLYEDFGITLAIDGATSASFSSVSAMQSYLGYGDCYAGCNAYTETYGITADSSSPGTHDMYYSEVNHLSDVAGAITPEYEGAPTAPDSATDEPYGVPFTSFLVLDSSVPTPASFAVLALGLACLAFARRKQVSAS